MEQSGHYCYFIEIQLALANIELKNSSLDVKHQSLTNGTVRIFIHS
jgi:hypothetical protein